MINIGVFDSGVGGLWILKHLKTELPGYNYVFFGDQAHVPYGVRQIEEIKSFSESIVKFLINKGCKIIVIACNTASTASLEHLRKKFPETIFIGMEPAIKPAVEMTHTNSIGVLATGATLKGKLYNSVIERFANGVDVSQNTCTGLVEQIEKGNLDSKKVYSILEKALKPMIAKNIDTVVLGCTHYPFIIPQIKKIVSEKVNIIDPTEAIVRQVSKVLDRGILLEKHFEDGKIDIFTSGKPKMMDKILSSLFTEKMNIKKIDWENDLELTSTPIFL